MGLYVDGVWKDQWYDTGKSGGRFEREPTRFRGAVTAQGGPFPAQAGRYHLYVSHACPWAHRTMIFRTLKKLEDAITVSVVSPLMGPQGWTFETAEGYSGDSVNGARKLGEIYLIADPKYSGRVTVPVLWDKETRGVVNNESSEIIRMLNSAFGACTPDRTDYYPQDLRAEIDTVNADVYANINNGVYRAGFATTQDAYEEAVRALFAALDRMEARLSGQRYLAGSAITEADWRLFTTLVRFDAVYFGHFKCNIRRIVDYWNLSNYLRELYQVPGVAETVHLDHIKRHYYWSHVQINPTRIVPVGPELDFSMPHDRAKYG
jgi:putative glutathione S-transferase